MALAMLGVFVGLSIAARRPELTTPAALAVLGGVAIAALRDTAPLTVVLMMLAIAGVAVVVAFAGWLLVGQADSEREQQVFVIGSLLLLGGSAAYTSLSAVFAGLLAGFVWNAAGDLATSAYRAASRLLPASAHRRHAPGGRSIDHVFNRSARRAGDRGGVSRHRQACQRAVSSVGGSGGDRRGARRLPGSRCGDSTRRRRSHRRRHAGDSPARAGGTGRCARHGARAWLHADRRARQRRVSSPVPAAAADGLSAFRPAGRVPTLAT